MAYSHNRHRHDPTDALSRSGLRPHEMPRGDDTGFGSLTVAAVLLGLFGLVIALSAFSGGGSDPAAAPAIDASGAAAPAAPASAD